MRSARDKMKTYNSFMAPRFPAYILDKSATKEDLLPMARNLFTRKYGFACLGDKHQPGDDVLIIAYAVQEMDVYEAIREAFLENGAASVNLIYWHDLGLPAGEYSCEDGWRDICPEHVEAVIGGTGSAEMKLLKKFLEEQRPKYTAIYGGEQGGGAIRKRFKQFKGPWIFRDYEDLATPYNHFNGELLRLIDYKLAEKFALAREVHVTDPEGTDMRWTVTEEEALLWSRAACTFPGHVLAATHQGLRTRLAKKQFGGRPEGSLKKWAPYAARLYQATNGVIGATSTHSGFVPHIQVYVKEGRIDRIEGGGKFGDLLHELVEKYRVVQYPGYPDTGYDYLNDCSITTNPKTLRKLEGMWKHSRPWYGIAYERFRAGAIHWGFGVQHDDPELDRFAEEQQVPAKHMPHLHQMFPTYEIKLASGQWLKLIDKGWLTILDDPEVRRFARMLADPDSILSYDWVTAMPGINMPGSFTDFAKAPVPWVKREMNGEFGEKIL